MTKPEADNRDDALQRLESMAEKVGARRLGFGEIVFVGALMVLSFMIGYRLSGMVTWSGYVLPSGVAPAPPMTGQPTFFLLGRYKDELYFFSEPNGKVFRYDRQSRSSESVFDISSYQAHVWSPEGGKIAIISTQNNDSGDLYVVDLSKPVQGPNALTQRSKSTIPKSFALISTSPMAWSPDETRIAFVAYDDDVTDIFVAAIDGSETTRVTTNQKNLSSIAWIDADTIAYVIRVDGQYKKCLIKTDGSGWQEW